MGPQQDFETWRELEQYALQLAEQNAFVSGQGLGYFSHLLFRGQGDSEWELTSTLDREGEAAMSWADYYRRVAIAKPQIETFTAHRWDEIDYQSIERRFSEYDGLVLPRALPAYDLLVYLRHHGFPSPLLDWSRSLYVAAFFAFQKTKGERVALYVYREHAGNGKVGSSNQSQIKVLGPYVRSHPRHFLQQGAYTVCSEFADNAWRFAEHSSVFQRDQPDQDQLWKLTVPASEANVVLRRLETYNINAFSLFQSEEALMETLAARAFAPE